MDNTVSLNQHLDSIFEYWEGKLTLEELQDDNRFQPVSKEAEEEALKDSY